MDTPLDIEQNIPLAAYTSIDLGGAAALFVRVTTERDVIAACEYAREHDVPLHVLGGGSNTIFADEGFGGLVVHIALRGVEFCDEGHTSLVIAEAGELWDDLVAQSVKRGLAGMECMSGIPGLVGATPMQNVGAYGQEVAEIIEWIEVVERLTGKLFRFSNKECRFGYRMSRFKQEDANKYIIVRVAYRLRSDGVPTLRYPQVAEIVGDLSKVSEIDGLQKVRQTVLGLRRGKSMLVDPSDPHSRSCGSFFTNPVIPKKRLAEIQIVSPDIPFFEGEESPHATAEASWAGVHVKVPAAWLIEQAGFAKGSRYGGVGISPNHPLALVNYDGSAQEIIELSDRIQDTVERKFGIRLEREPVYVV